MVTPSENKIADTDILGALEHILSSPDFEASERNRRFLRHIVQETLAGRSDRIKAYCIATEVFGRNNDFDPQQDSIVRIEAGRLRRALEHFYLKDADSAGIRISIPKGSYVPRFSRGEQTKTTPQKPPGTTISEPLHSLGPRILVEDLDQEGYVDDYPTIGRTLTRQLISALTRFTELFVYGVDARTSHGTDEDKPERHCQIVVDYIILGTVTIAKGTLHAELLMKKTEDGRFVWAQSFTRALETDNDPARIVSLCAEISGHIARVVALRDGIMDSQARDNAEDTPSQFAGYQKLLDFQDYWRSLDPALFEPLRQDLEESILKEPNFAAAHACLSLLYSNAARYGYDVSESCASPIDRATDLARKAIQLAPSSSKAFHARAVAEWFSGFPQESLATLQIARSLNPNDPEIAAELGFRSAMRMDWDVAVPLLQDAYARNPLQTKQYRMGLFLFYFSEGRYDRALQETRLIDAPGIAFVHLAAAAALSGLGRLEDARNRLDEAQRLAPNLHLKLREDLTFRQIHPTLISAIMRALGDVDPNWNPKFDTPRLHAR